MAGASRQPAKGTEFRAMTLEEIIKESSGGIYNNAARTWNPHVLLGCMKPSGGA
jgi:Fe-Mn family superoxide dismutase